jgi:spore coat polysaccharide biosynthesis protein SpsF
MKKVCIIQARMGSTRLPGKVLLPLNGHTVIREVVTRCWAIPGIDLVCVATPDWKIADTIDGICHVVFGSEHDVLGRYELAARMTHADVVMRITADCPLLSPQLCGAVLADLGDADYISNVHPRTFPQGYDCEVFTRETLEMARRWAEDGDHEHVTTWMLRAPIERKNFAGQWHLDGRLTLDTEDDYRVICAAFGHQPYERIPKSRPASVPLSAA